MSEVWKALYLNHTQKSRAFDRFVAMVAELNTLFRSLMEEENIQVGISRHAIERLSERRSRDYKKLTAQVLENAIANMVKDGKYWVGRRSIKILTKKHTLICTVVENQLFIKTVVRVKADDAKLLARAKPTPWKRVIIVKAPRRIPKLRLQGIGMIVFDMDGVLVDIDGSWQSVHRAFGVNNEGNYLRFVRGEINYKEFMKSDISLWGRVHIDLIEKVLKRVPLMRGAKETVFKLRMAGYKTSIISSGISVLAERLKSELGIDHVLANKLVVDENGILTGEGEENVGLMDKASALTSLVNTVTLATENCAVVGDGVYDVPMFELAGFSIAFNTRDENVKKAANVVMEEKNLEKILPYFLS
jgi:phosphoserine phosphatase